jgi:hypothetical protein
MTVILRFNSVPIALLYKLPSIEPPRSSSPLISRIFFLKSVAPAKFIMFKTPVLFPVGVFIGLIFISGSGVIVTA